MKAAILGMRFLLLVGFVFVGTAAIAGCAGKSAHSIGPGIGGTAGGNQGGSNAPVNPTDSSTERPNDLPNDRPDDLPIDRPIDLPIDGSGDVPADGAGAVNPNATFDPLTVQVADKTLRLKFCTDAIVRVTFGQLPTAPAVTNGATQERPSLAVIDPCNRGAHTISSDGRQITVTTTKLQVKIDIATGAVSFADPTGKAIVAEAPQGHSIIDATVMGEATHHVQQSFALQAGDALYGLGQFENTFFNYRGHDVLLVQANRDAVNPFLLSTGNWGVLWDNTSETTFHDGADGTSFSSEVGDDIDYYFVSGVSMDQVVAGYRLLTGAAPLLPRWAYGYWQSKERYLSGAELQSVSAEFRTRQIPIDVIVQDWQWWGASANFSGMVPDPTTFPNPRGLFQTLHDTHHVHALFSIWPAVGQAGAVHQELAAGKMLYSGGHWGGGDVYDAFNPAARAIYWKYANQGLFSQGLDGWWMDGSEPEFTDVNTPMNFEGQFKMRQSTFLGTVARVLNPYSLPHTAAVYEGQRSVTSDKRVVILTRSSFAGQQRNSAITWSGDTTGTPAVLAWHIPAGINFSMAGIPYWTHDIGGFFVDGFTDTANPLFRELYVRWFEFGAFTPIFRSHGTSLPREPWRFGNPGDWAYDALLKFDRLRYRLLPYIYSLAWRVTNEGYSFMRGLPMDFPDDVATHNLATEYLLGPSLLVRPVTDRQYAGNPTVGPTQSVSVYLPAAARWFDFWTGAPMTAGQTTRVTPIDLMPLYVRAGSILPLGPDLQYSSEHASDPIELRIYPGASGDFTLYEDEGDNYNYEKGTFATIPFHWNDAAGTLTIGARVGTFPGLLSQRTFRVVWVAANHGGGIDPTAAPDRTVTYDGTAQTVQHP